MTQKEKLQVAFMTANSLKRTAQALRAECKSYDETWALKYATEIEDKCNDLLNKLK